MDFPPRRLSCTDGFESPKDWLRPVMNDPDPDVALVDFDKGLPPDMPGLTDFEKLDPPPLIMADWACFRRPSSRISTNVRGPMNAHLVDTINSKFQYWLEQGLVKDSDEFSDHLRDPSFGFGEEGPTDHPLYISYAADLADLRKQISEEAAVIDPETVNAGTQEEIEDLANDADRQLRGMGLAALLHVVDIPFCEAMSFNGEVSYGTPLQPEQEITDVVLGVLAPLMMLLGVTNVEIQPIDPNGQPLDAEQAEEWATATLRTAVPLMKYRLTRG